MKQQNSTPDLRKRARPNYGRVLFHFFLCMALTFLMATPAFAAGDEATIWTVAQKILKDVYNQVVVISSVAAVATASVALLLMNFSKNDRTVSESRAWLKRIIVTWCILNGLGFVMAYVTPFFQGGKYIVPNV